MLICTLEHVVGLMGAERIYTLRRVLLPLVAPCPSENLSPQRHPPVGAEKAYPPPASSGTARIRHWLLKSAIRRSGKFTTAKTCLPRRDSLFG